jgi:choline kinase
MYKVLITTSGTGSRLGDLTLFTNKCLVRVGKKPAISYIVESYDDNVEIVVTLGHYKNHVRDYLIMNYPNKKFNFVEVGQYEGAGSSLGYSLLHAESNVQCPFIFHASDTIVFDKIPKPDSNWLGYTVKNDSSQYRTLDLNSRLKINEKGDINSNSVYIGLAGINDYESFWKNLKEEYKSDKNNQSLSDCHSINKMFELKWDFFNFENWLDIGNVSSLRESRNTIKDKFNILDKKDESIFIFDDSVVKFFHNKDLCRNRVNRVKHLGNLVPRIIDSCENFYKYEYIDGELFSSVVNEISFRKFLEWSFDKLWMKMPKNDSFKEICNDFYFKKTMNRVNDFLKSNNLEDSISYINGYEVPSVLDMIESIDKDWLCSEQPYRFHGDYILDNIIVDGDGFKMIDWRQDFGGDLENGDIYYDLSKLNHNLLFNHEIVNNGNFSIEIKNNIVKCDILRSDNLSNCRKILHDFITENDFDLVKVELLTSIVWLNMSPLHDSKMGFFLFYFGKLNLFKALQKISKYGK